MHDAAAQLQLFRDADEPDTRSGFAVRESGRARRMSIKVYPRGRVEVVVPRRSRAAEVEAFVAANRDWIQKTLAAFAEEHPPEPFALPQRVELPGVGLPFRVRYEPQRGSKSVRYRTSGNLLVLRGRTNDESLCIAALKRWLASVAKREFLPMLTALSKRTGEPFSRMHVRGQRTCWGSHS